MFRNKKTMIVTNKLTFKTFKFIIKNIFGNKWMFKVKKILFLVTKYYVEWKIID